MPKVAKSEHQWKQGLNDFANGKFHFGRLKTTRDTKWGFKLESIEKCQCHRNKAMRCTGETNRLSVWLSQIIRK